MNYLWATSLTNRIRNEHKGIFWSMANSIRLVNVNDYKCKKKGKEIEVMVNFYLLLESLMKM